MQGPVPAWQSRAEGAAGGANAAHLVDRGAHRYQGALLSQAFMAPSRGAWVGFRQRRARSWANTVGALEIAIAGLAFTDIVTAGDELLAGGYDGRSCASNRSARKARDSPDPAAIPETDVSLPGAAQGQHAQLRCRY